LTSISSEAEEHSVVKKQNDRDPSASSASDASEPELEASKFPENNLAEKAGEFSTSTVSETPEESIKTERSDDASDSTIGACRKDMSIDGLPKDVVVSILLH